MAIDLEGKLELGEERDGQPLYFAIVRKAEGWFALEFRDNCGKPCNQRSIGMVQPIFW
jgi:hypothetical protein